MKKILAFLAIVLFTLHVGAQETNTATQKKQEKSCSSHDAHSEKMTKEEIALCKAKCKAEGKKCTAKDMSKCKKDEKTCSADEQKEGKNAVLKNANLYVLQQKRPDKSGSFCYIQNQNLFQSIF